MTPVDRLKEKILLEKRKLDYNHRNFPISGLVGAEDIEDYESQLDKLQLLTEELSIDIEQLNDCFSNQVPADDLATLKTVQASYETSATKFRREVRYKIGQLKATTIAATSRAPSVSGSVADAGASSTGSEAYQKKVAKATATSNMDYLKKCLESLVRDSNEHDWEEANDVDVENTMHNIKD